MSRQVTTPTEATPLDVRDVPAGFTKRKPVSVPPSELGDDAIAYQQRLHDLANFWESKRTSAQPVSLEQFSDDVIAAADQRACQPTGEQRRDTVTQMPNCVTVSARDTVTDGALGNTGGPQASPLGRHPLDYPTYSSLAEVDELLYRFTDPNNQTALSRSYVYHIIGRDVKNQAKCYTVMKQDDIMSFLHLRSLADNVGVSPSLNVKLPLYVGLGTGPVYFFIDLDIPIPKTDTYRERPAGVEHQCYELYASELRKFLKALHDAYKLPIHAFFHARNGKHGIHIHCNAVFRSVADLAREVATRWKPLWCAVIDCSVYGPRRFFRLPFSTKANPPISGYLGNFVPEDTFFDGDNFRVNFLCLNVLLNVGGCSLTQHEHQHPQPHNIRTIPPTYGGREAQPSIRSEMITDVNITTQLSRLLADTTMFPYPSGPGSFTVKRQKLQPSGVVLVVLELSTSHCLLANKSHENVRPRILLTEHWITLQCFHDGCKRKAYAWPPAFHSLRTQLF